MTNLELPVKLTCMFLTVGEPGEHADSTPSHIQSLVFICWQGLEKLILQNNLFKQLNQNLQVSTFFLLFVLSGAHKLADVSHRYTNTYTQDSYYIQSWKWPTALALFCQSLWGRLSLPNSSLHITFPATLLVSADWSQWPATSWRWRCWCSISLWLIRTVQTSHDICVTAELSVF